MPLATARWGGIFCNPEVTMPIQGRLVRPMPDSEAFSRERKEGLQARTKMLGRGRKVVDDPVLALMLAVIDQAHRDMRVKSTSNVQKQDAREFLDDIRRQVTT